MHSLTYYKESLKISEDQTVYKKLRQQIQPFRGIRGIPFSVIAKELDEEYTVTLPEQSEELYSLFLQSFEEGLIAIGILSVAALSQPENSWELVQRWLPMIDDVITSDAIGKIVIGPCALQLNLDIPNLISEYENVYAKRALYMSLCAFVPSPPIGPWVSALRSHLQSEQIIFIEKPITHHYEHLFSQFLKMEIPLLRKAIVHLVQLWSTFDLLSIDKKIQNHPQNLPNWLKKSYEKGRRQHNKT